VAPQAEKLVNPVKARMQAGEVALGMPVRLARSGDIARIAKTTGHDFIFIDCQHSLFNLETIGHIASTALGCGIAPLTDLLAAVLAWATASPTLAALTTAIGNARERLTALRAAEPRLTLATAHATKGLEFDHVAVIGMSEGRFPSPRALADAGDPTRALEEERRLAYVAWTRARRSLTLAYEPDSPSRFLVEAFGLAVIDTDGTFPVRA